MKKAAEFLISCYPLLLLLLLLLLLSSLLLLILLLLLLLLLSLLSLSFFTKKLVFRSHIYNIKL